MRIFSRRYVRRAVAATMVAPVATGLMLVISAPSAEASPPFQGDCGSLTCTVRLDRAQTRNARDAGAVIGIVAGACASVSLGTLAPVCGAAIAPAAGITALAAARFYEQGDCLQIKFSKIPGPGGLPVGIPGSVRRGTRNCN
jgi:hypothetical protein